MAKVTVIVPTYNVEAYIAKCLDSLVSQTYDDYEVYVVNDGSPANEQPIIDEYASKYDVITPIIKENGGYGSVLELAIAKMESEYFLICDPDDWLEQDAIEKLVSTIEETNSDIVIGAKNLVFSDNDEIKYDKTFNADFANLENMQTFKNGTSEFDQFFFVEPSPHSKLYKTKLAKAIKFPHKVGYTDNLLYFMSLIQAKQVTYLSEPLAYYLIDRVGNTRTDLRPGVIDAFVKVFTTIIEQSEQVNNVPDMFYYRMFETFKGIFYKVDEINTDQVVYEEKLRSVYQVLERLLKHNKVIKPLYKKNAQTRIIEKYKDLKLLTPQASKKMFDKWVTKRVEAKF